MAARLAAIARENQDRAIRRAFKRTARARLAFKASPQGPSRQLQGLLQEKTCGRRIPSHGQEARKVGPKRQREAILGHRTPRVPES